MRLSMHGATNHPIITISNEETTSFGVHAAVCLTQLGNGWQNSLRHRFWGYTIQMSILPWLSIFEGPWFFSALHLASVGRIVVIPMPLGLLAIRTGWSVECLAEGKAWDGVSLSKGWKPEKCRYSRWIRELLQQHPQQKVKSWRGLRWLVVLFHSNSFVPYLGSQCQQTNDFNQLVFGQAVTFLRWVSLNHSKNNMFAGQCVLIGRHLALWPCDKWLPHFDLRVLMSLSVGGPSQWARLIIRCLVTQRKHTHTVLVAGKQASWVLLAASYYNH